MGSIGDCHDNGMIESIWGQLHRRRRHTALGMLTLVKYELASTPAQPVA